MKARISVSVVRGEVVRGSSHDDYLTCDKITFGYEKEKEIPELPTAGAMIVDDGLVVSRIEAIGFDIEKHEHVLYLSDAPMRRKRRLARRKDRADDTTLLAFQESLQYQGLQPKAKIVAGDGQVDPEGKQYIAAVERLFGKFTADLSGK